MDWFLKDLGHERVRSEIRRPSLKKVKNFWNQLFFYEKMRSWLRSNKFEIFSKFRLRKAERIEKNWFAQISSEIWRQSLHVLGIVTKFCAEYLANLSELINFSFPWNHQKTKGFLMISGGKKLINSLNITKEIWRRSLSFHKSKLINFYSP